VTPPPRSPPSHEEDAVKRIAIATALAIPCCLTAVVSLSAQAANRSAPPCVPKLQKLNGQPVVYECGPATATLHAGGKTYTYRSGLCQQSKSAGLGLALDLGTLAATAKGNAGKAYLSIAVAKIGGTVNGYEHGKLIANDLVTISGSFPKQGTFKSRTGGSGSAANFSGSWNCHGVVWQAP
jgi:hypothetical protein